ncbi:MAG: PQQ-binding-like beta-propeller repeat protein [Verrucomicrobia bacterium]|nr:PQQ-binding-like beta-propeller repeat protein [Verrucomicrobiota bacterium]
MNATVSDSAAPPPIPDHELLRLVGRGSYGEVWLARNVMGTCRAAKIVFRHTFDSDRPFEREFAGIQKFEPVSRSHEGLVQVLHVGRNPAAGCFYYVMELADDALVQGSEFKVQSSCLANESSDGSAAGSKTTLNLEPRTLNPQTYVPRTLRADLQRRGALPVDQLLDVGLALAAALGHLHKSGLIHRDLKPSNIIFVRGRPKLADIGLVSELGESRSFVGTEGFIPPEGPGTSSADLYSLGKVLYEAATGLDRLRFPEIPPAWLELPSGHGLLEFHEIILKACEGQAARRYQTAEDMQADLALLQSGRSVRRMRSLERHLSLLKKASLVSALIGGLAVGGYLLAALEARREHERARRIEHAEQEARRQLWNSLLAQARAGRRSGMSGARVESLQALRQAAAASNSMELRNEAIACLALPDLLPRAPLPLPGADESHPRLHPSLETYASSDTAGRVTLRRVKDQAELASWPGGGVPVETMSFVPASPNHLLAADTDGAIRLWDVDQRTLRFALTNLSAGVVADFSAARGLVAVGRIEERVELLDLETRAVRKTIPLPCPAAGLAFSHDGQRLAVALSASNAVVVVGTDNAAAEIWLPHPARVDDLRWAPSGRTLVTAAGDACVRLWEIPAGRLSRVLGGHQARLTALALHPHGELLATSSWDGTTCLWDMASGHLWLALPSAGTELRFSSDGRQLALLPFGRDEIMLHEIVDDRICRLWTEPEPAVRGDDTKGPWGVAFSPDDRQLATASYDGVRVWNVAERVELAHLPSAKACSVMFHPGRRELLVCRQDGVFRWPLATAGSGALSFGAPETISATDDNYQRGCLSDDGQVLAYLHGDHITVRRDGILTGTLPCPERPYWLALSPDCRWLAACTFGHPSLVRLWDLPTREEAWRTEVTGSACVAFAPDNRWLVTGGGEEVCFWDVATGRPGWRFPRRNAATLQGPVAFSRDGRLLALALTRTEVQLRDARTGAELAVLESPLPRTISALTFNHAGDQLAVVTESHLIQLWNLATLRCRLAELNLDWAVAPSAK